MNFRFKNALKRLGVFGVMTFICIISVGITSFASYSPNSEIVVKNVISSYELIILNSELDFLKESETKLIEEIDDTFYLNGSVASTSNIFNNSSVVTTADELEEAIVMAEEGDVIIIGSNIHLSKAIKLSKSISLLASEGVEYITIFSDNGRHFEIIGNEIHLSTKNIILDGNELGGGIYTSANHLTLAGILIQNCLNYYNGGGIYANGEVTLVNLNITGNMAMEAGGGIYVIGEMIINNSNIVKNESDYGGGIYAHVETTITNSDIVENESSYGGGILTHGETTLTNLNVIGNIAINAGGGIYAYNEVTITDSELTKNRADNGAGIYTRKDVTVLDSVIAENKANYGGGIYANGEATLVNLNIDRNIATKAGGGAYVIGEMKITNSNIVKNESDYGGGIYAHVKTTITNSDIVENESGYGGGILTHGETTLTNLNIIGNIAISAGGGIYAYNEVIIADSKLSENRADNGAGIYASKSITVLDSTITQNGAINGGGIYVKDGITITNSDMVKNEAINGGGMYIQINDGVAVIIENCRIIRNVASVNGGGIYANADDIVSEFDDFLRISNCKILNNTSANGGGIYTNIGWLRICNDSIVKNNIAEKAYQLIDENDIMIHNQKIDSTITWSQGFDYIYNNFDVSYNKGISVDIYTINVTEIYDDYNYNLNIYSVMQNKSFCYEFSIPEGYEAIIESNVDLDINIEIGKIDIELVSSDIDIKISYKKIENIDIYTVTLATCYLDGIQLDKVEIYQVRSGESFKKAFEIESGYRIGAVQAEKGVSVDFLTQMVEVESVKKDIVVTIICR